MAKDKKKNSEAKKAKKVRLDAQQIWVPVNYAERW
jgi:hypothetical protein